MIIYKNVGVMYTGNTKLRIKNGGKHSMFDENRDLCNIHNGVLHIIMTNEISNYSAQFKRLIVSHYLRN